MIPRYRGKIRGGRSEGRRRRHRLAILVEAARFLSSLALLYLAAVCAFGIALSLAGMLTSDNSGAIAGIPVVRQLAIQAALIDSYGKGVLPVLLVLALMLVVMIHFLANLLVEDIIDR